MVIRQVTKLSMNYRQGKGYFTREMGNRVREISSAI